MISSSFLFSTWHFLLTSSTADTSLTWPFVFLASALNLHLLGLQLHDVLHNLPDVLHAQFLMQVPLHKHLVSMWAVLVPPDSSTPEKEGTIVLISTLVLSPRDFTDTGLSLWSLMSLPDALHVDKFELSSLGMHMERRGGLNLVLELKVLVF